MILIAAIGIIAVSVERLLNPREIQHINVGLAISVVASLVNFGVARILFRAGQRNRSIALEADAQHLMTDVWTSGGVVVGVGLVALTHWSFLDPIAGIGVAAHVAWMGGKLLRRSINGLMDVRLPDSEVSKVKEVLKQFTSDEIQYHALLTRQAGARSFVSVHIQVPGGWSVQRGHDLAEEIEWQIREVLPLATVFTHIEPREDPLSFADVYLDRGHTHWKKD